MALDGIVLRAITAELRNEFIGGRVTRINQPEKDELIFLINSMGKRQQLLISAYASLPSINISRIKKPNPPTPPAHCMFLRKVLNNAIITDINQIGLERIVKFTFSHYDEMGDLSKKNLIVEIMGKHSNIILTSEDGIILESIKRIGANISSVRQVYPGRQYVLPPSQNKHEPEKIETYLEFYRALFYKKNELDNGGALVKKQSMPIQKALYMTFTGFSPLIADRICICSGIEPSLNLDLINEDQVTRIYKTFKRLIDPIRGKYDYSLFQPYIIMQNNEFIDFHVIEFLENREVKKYDSISHLLEDYYMTKKAQDRIRQKSADLRTLLHTLLDRSYKKLELQERQYKDSQNLDKFKLKGELLMAYQYQLPQQADKVEVWDYYEEKNRVIGLDPQISLAENAKKAYEKYNKKKRTIAALDKQLIKTRYEINHLESIQYQLDIAEDVSDLDQLRLELKKHAYISKKGLNNKSKKKKNKVKSSSKSNPLHYITDEGFHLYVGRNNEQNEYLSLKFANNNDWFFHAKDMPGSHVIAKLEGKELTDRAFEQAASLAAYYSKGRNSGKVEVDYTRKKELKKPKGSPLGYVIYHTNYSMISIPEIKGMTLLEN